MTQARHLSSALGAGSIAAGLETASLWRTFRCLVEAKEVYGISAQALATLRALVSFLKDGGDPVVYASNRTICKRAEGLSERTVRRHVAALAKAGLLARHDSANGKRYCLTHPDGLSEVYGLDLSPLAARSAEIAAAAAEAARERSLAAFYRKRLSGLLYHAQCAGHEEIEQTHRPALRRKLTAARLRDICEDIEGVLARDCAEVQAAAIPSSAGDMTANDGESVRHKIRTENKDIDSEEAPHALNDGEPELLEKIRASCPEALTYAERPPESLWELEEHAWTLASWCGIGRDLIAAAVARIGRSKAAVTVFGLFSRMDCIRNLPAYFNSLTVGKRARDFDPMRLLSVV